MLGSEFTLFGNLLEADIPKKNINVEELVTMIKTGTEKAVIEDLRKTKSRENYKQIKKTKIPCVTLSGIFTHRDAKSLVKHSGYMQIDIDKVSEYNELFENLSYDIYTLACFKSPGGEGIKVIVKINPSANSHTQQFYALERYYKENYNIEIDPSCKDVARAMLLSFDPNIFYNPNSEVFTELFQTEVTQKTESKNGTKAESYLNPTDSNLQLIESITAELERRRIDITNNYANWIKVGFALCNEFGDEGRSYFLRLSAMHPEYKADTCSKLYDQLLLRDSGQVTIASIVYLAKENGVIIKRQKRQLTDFELRLALQNFRTEVYRKENIFAYEVFNNKSLEALVNQRPKNPSELKTVYGFNQEKVNWIGSDLIKILNWD